MRPSAWLTILIASVFKTNFLLVTEVAEYVQLWTGSDPDLLTWLDQHHCWTPQPEDSNSYLEVLRQHTSAGPSHRFEAF